MSTDYVAGLAYTGAQVGWWHLGLLTATGFWTVTVAIVLLFDLRAVVRERWYLRREVRRVITVALLIEFIVGLSDFNLAIELAIQVTLGFAMMVQVTARQNSEHAVVGKLMQGILALAGIWLIADGAVELVGRVRNGQVESLTQELLLPVWLTIGFVPIMWVIGTIAGYELGVKELLVRRSDESLVGRLRGMVALIAVFRTRRDLVDRFALHTRSVNELMAAGSLGAAVSVVREFRDRWEYREDVAQGASDDWMSSRALRVLTRVASSLTDESSRRRVTPSDGWTPACGDTTASSIGSQMIFSTYWWSLGRSPSSPPTARTSG